MCDKGTEKKKHCREDLIEIWRLQVILDEISDENEEQNIIGNWRKGVSCNKVAKDLIDEWFVIHTFMTGETGCFCEEIYTVLQG